jgi:N6-adenosine-specific RNA methylase IME4
MQIYAQQAKDRELIYCATEIRLRAERRAGELLAEMKECNQRDTGMGGDRKSRSPDATVKLADLGVTKQESSRWQKLAKLDDRPFEDIIRTAKDRAIESMERTQTRSTKASDRARREAELGAKQRALPQQKFGVILADPEWRCEPCSRETGMDRAADNHYPTSVVKEIAQRDVLSISHDDCILFLWATVPMLSEAITVMQAWGFTYKSNFVWVKDRIGAGCWSRNRHELLLIGTRGHIPAPAMGTQACSVIEAPVGERSEKPNIVYELIEGWFPNVPKIELNGRHTRDGWFSWGVEAPASESDPKPVIQDYEDIWKGV